ncbi:hypothetical protein HMPREF2780_02330 [Streptococcus sp. HMSC062B01]|jgi:hypothetical protein|uniref:hypothetical protein n=1 Tax=Streptococcus sp. HMSC062B01 TaxID=1739284 RepID=UPI0008CABDCE|nr:hypothetical protein [Streptococcus sp. HMSC062B01]OFL22310.1 hypothetical protein HMPREF2780_02330 [Streptococcus sp. HMSC062B01]
MENFEIQIPEIGDFEIDVRKKELYNYNFHSYSLVPLQKEASLIITDKIRNNLFAHIPETKLLKKLLEKNDDVEYVAKLSKEAKEKIKTGEWSYGIRKKTGETYAVLKDTETGKIKSSVTLDKRVVQDLGNLPELSAIQSQLASISEQIESLNELVIRVEQGQYNDRFSGFFSSRQLILEALATKNEQIKRDLLLSAIKENNSTISKLMLSIFTDSTDFTKSKLKPKDADRIGNLLHQSISYLSSSVQLNVIAYTMLEEQEAVMAVLSNYQGFMEQTLLDTKYDGKSLAWKIDNFSKGDSNNFNQLTQGIVDKVDELINSTENLLIEEK